MANASHLRIRVLAAVSVAGMLMLTLHSVVLGVPSEAVQAVFVECADGIDNDQDGHIDYPQDPECDSIHDETEGPTRGLFVEVTDQKQTVEPGGSLTYLINLRTERDEEQYVDVRFQMPHQTNLIGTTPPSLSNGAVLTWSDVAVFPGKLRQLTVTVEVDPDADEDLLLVTEVLANYVTATDTTRVELDDDAEIASRTPLKISITDGKKYAQPGEVLDYVIAVRNPTNDPRAFDLRFQIPTDTEVEFVGGEGHSANRQAITWSDQSVGPHGAREYRVSLRLDHALEEFVSVTARASSAASSAVDTTTIHTGVLPNAVVVTTTDGLEQIVPGALVTYDIALQNLTNQLATEVDVNNALPSYLEFVDATEGGYWTGKNIRWEGMTVAPNGNRMLRVTGRVRSDAPMGERLRNRVAVNGYESVDTTIVADQVAGAGLAANQGVMVTKNADRAEVRPGETVRYTVTVRNVTNHPIENLKVDDRMESPHVRILNADQGVAAGNRVSWTVPYLAPGEVWNVSYDAQVDYRAPHGLSIPNIVTVSGQGMETVSLEERIYTMQIGVISNLPPTGAAFDALFLLATGLAGAGQTFATRRKIRK